MTPTASGTPVLPAAEKTADNAVFSSVTLPPPAAGSPAINSTDSLLQVSGALSGIILLILGLTWLVRKFGFTAKLAGKNPLLRIRSTCSLGNKERLVVAEIQGEWLVLGVTAQSVNLLHRCPADPAAVTDAPSAFQALLKTKRTANHDAVPADEPR
ncbi:TPA: flagellar biosynthetic protein FliO [Morganella morganii]|nr:flagellar biosynthetic protein FliO [Morganella morganii]HBH7051584.1 flagellar biosynthetic protein FliO [Morganella morganii]